MPPSPLAAPLDLPCGVRLANRIGKSAMTEALAGPDDAPNVAHDTLYARWSKGGMAVQLTGNVMIDRRHLERPGNVVVEDRRDLQALKSWAAAGKSGGSRIWMQISHPGRQCPIVVNMRPLSPSAEKLRILGLFGKPREMTEADIEDVIQRYATTAQIAQEAGFDGVQIHAAHGYLISQFLSPITNRRGDRWGGSVENRARFLRRVYSAVRATVGPGFPVAVKLNSADFQKGGFSLEDSTRVAAWLEEDGIDLIELSGGTYEQMSFVNGTDTSEQRDSNRRREAYFLDYARELRKAVNVPIMVTGGFRSTDAMEQALTEDGIDMIGLARPLCIDPDAAGKLIGGTKRQVGIDEAGLMLGTGSLGANTKSWFINLVNTASSVEYYVSQMTRMSRGEQPQTIHRISTIGTFLWYLTMTTVNGVRRKIG
ncbi:NADH:flavin oxidoreductase/NADH oxidase family protein [Marivita geojedonensis]|uniref:NADH:flavin oxidoreductase/NADH oxidase family protein n=1 Tax=Marivita geojedonensis TaxID=1123756 RepID=UPI000A1E8BC4|nr:NADH:flavin oxidoreductase/NADH oxidase family protein [Marivita geojedonensis]PRY77970.1 2,4-dienoyl-CoA reductase-like NADH-dependent reductase (Old Yellow Enzyme family) [Marivita geojedonensis]